MDKQLEEIKHQVYALLSESAATFELKENKYKIDNILDLILSYSLSTSDELLISKTKSFISDYRDLPLNIQTSVVPLQEVMVLLDDIAANDKVSFSASELKHIKEIWAEKREPKKLLFSAAGISKRHSKKSDFQLSDIDLTIKESDIVGLVGRNGTGKTTLLKIIAGIHRQEKGTVKYHFVDSSDKTANYEQIKYRISYLPQELPQLNGSVKKSIQFSAAIHGLKGSQNAREVDYVIRRLGLERYANARWNELSSGYKLRFHLAKILVWRPRLMILDEPLANLDVMAQAEVLADLRDLADSIKQPFGVILSSQNIEEVEAVANKMIVLKKGKSVFTGHIADLSEEMAHNIYEFQLNNETIDVKTAFSGLKQVEVASINIFFRAKTPKETTSTDFLAYCINNGIELKYFRDITQSSKRFFYNEDT